MTLRRLLSPSHLLLWMVLALSLPAGLAAGCESTPDVDLDALITQQEARLLALQKRAMERAMLMRKVERAKQKLRKEHPDVALPKRSVNVATAGPAITLPESVSMLDNKKLERLKSTKEELRRLEKIVGEVDGLHTDLEALEALLKANQTRPAGNPPAASAKKSGTQKP